MNEPLHVDDRVVRRDVERDGLAGEGLDEDLELIVVIIEVRGEEAEQNVLRGFRRCLGALIGRRRLGVISVALFVGAAGKGSG